MDTMGIVEEAIRTDPRIESKGDTGKPWPRVKVEPVGGDLFHAWLCECGNRCLIDFPGSRVVRAVRRSFVEMHRHTYYDPVLPGMWWVWVGQCPDCGTIYHALRPRPEIAHLD